MNDTAIRFLSEIVERIGVDDITEIRLFRPIRQGQAETGVAVVAALPQGLASQSVPLHSATAQIAASPAQNVSSDPVEGDMEAHPADSTTIPVPEEPGPIRQEASGPIRHTVFSARYRLLVKGPDRGKWEVDVTPEADAPLITVDDVVQGVMRRAGEELEPERISASALRSIVGIKSPTDCEPV